MMEFRVVVPVANSLNLARRKMLRDCRVRLAEGLVISSDSSNSRQTLFERIFINSLSGTTNSVIIVSDSSTNVPLGTLKRCSGLLATMYFSLWRSKNGAHVR